MPLPLSNTPDVLNTAGHAAGALIFGIFGVLYIKDRFSLTSGKHMLAASAALLAFIWNATSLAALLSQRGEAMERMSTGIGFIALSMLPAVLFHLSLESWLRPLVRVGYAVSLLAVLAHVAALFGNRDAYHRIGLIAITSGFGILTAIAAIAILRSTQHGARPLLSRAVTTMSLFLFAITFIHFSGDHHRDSWAVELLVHHAGIPLALFVILHDFRFVLLDALVRFVASGLLAGTLAAVVVFAIPLWDLPAQVMVTMFALGTYSVLKDHVQRLLSRAVFRQPDPEQRRKLLAELQDSSLSEADYVCFALERIALLMHAHCVDVVEETPDLKGTLQPVLATDEPAFASMSRRGIRAIVPIRAASQFGLFSGRSGGRPYLSEDLEVIAQLASAASEHLGRLRSAELQRLVSQAELRALQSQINPHFLFNALNTLYGVVPREATLARKLVLDLAETFRYFLRTERAFVPLEEELRIVRSYLAIEEARLGTKLQTAIEVDESALRELIPTLSIQPIVENAVKHGAAAYGQGGSVRLEVRRETEGLRVSVFDTGPGFSSFPASKSSGTGIGLANVSRRLALCYGQPEPLLIRSDSFGTCVSFVVAAKPA